MIFVYSFKYIRLFTCFLLILCFSVESFANPDRKRQQSTAGIGDTKPFKSVHLLPGMPDDAVFRDENSQDSLVAQLESWSVTPDPMSEASQLSYTSAESDSSILLGNSENLSQKVPMQIFRSDFSAFFNGEDSPGPAFGSKGVLTDITNTQFPLGSVMDQCVPVSPQKPKILKQRSKIDLEKLRRSSARRRVVQEKIQKENIPTHPTLLQEYGEYQGLMKYINTHLDCYAQATQEDLTPLKYGAVIRAARAYLKVGGFISRVYCLQDPTLSQIRYVLQVDQLINHSCVDDKGRNSLQRMKLGKAPFGPDGKRIHLHHLAQSDRYELIEASAYLHEKYHGALHFKPGGKSAQDGLGIIDICHASEGCHEEIDREAFRAFAYRYWRERAAQIEKTLSGLTPKRVLVF